MVLEPAPLPATEIAARSRVMLHGAAHGSLCTAALAGLVQVGLPDHKEQLVHGQKAVEAGLMRMLPCAGWRPGRWRPRCARRQATARRRVRRMRPRAPCARPFRRIRWPIWPHGLPPKLRPRGGTLVTG